MRRKRRAETRLVNWITVTIMTFLSTCVNQFGFKKHHSTEMLIFLLKELFRHYIANGSSMYVTMLDASKALTKSIIVSYSPN